MTRKILVLLACVLVSSGPIFVPLEAAGRSSRRVPSLSITVRDALTRSLRAGRIGEEEYALQRARSLFDLRAVRARFGNVDRPGPRDATIVLRDLLARLPDLSGPQRRAATALLARPTDGASDPEGSGYTVPEAPPVCSTNLCIHYVGTSVDAPAPEDADVNGVPDYIDTVSATFEEVWAAEITSMGYRPPKPDGNSGNDGGDARTDIYVGDVGADGVFGYCTSDDPRAFSPRYPYFDASAFCVVDDDYDPAQFPGGAVGVDALRVTAAHEFFHAVQFAYDAFEDAWFQEATAVWMEDEVYDAIDDNRAYLAEGPLGLPHIPLDSFFAPANPNALFAYGTWIYIRRLSEVHGRDVVREMWELADGSRVGENQYSVRAIATTLTRHGTTFAQSFVDFGSANVVPAFAYEEGAAYPEPPSARSHLLDDPALPVADVLQLDHMSHRFISLTPGSTVAETDVVTVRVDLPSGVAWARAGIVIVDAEDPPEIMQMTLDEEGRGSLTVPFGGREEVVLVLSNGSVRFRNCFQLITRFSCGGGIPRDDDRGFSYSAQIGPVAPTPADPGDASGDVTPPRISRVSDAPDPFTPNGDGRRDRTTIRWTVSEGADTTVAVFTRAGSGIVNLGRAFTQPGRWFIRWGGRNAAGRKVPAGTYVYRITAVDVAGNRRTAEGRVTVRR